MVLTITTNPMLDKTLFLPKFEIGNIYRSTKVEDVAGGKGINVSLQLTELGVENIATGFLGGEIGLQIKHILDNDNIKNDFVWVKGNTRIGFTVLDESNLVQTSVFEPNHKVSEDEKNKLSEKVNKYSSLCNYIAISGSVPDKSISGIYYDMINLIKNNNENAKIFFDSYGEEFKIGINAKPFFVKQNKKEAELFFNKPLIDEKDFLQALDSYIDIHFAILTNGVNYSYIKYENDFYRVKPPKVNVINPIGSGDTITAGLIYGFIKNYDFIDIIRFAFAAAASNASKWVIARNKYEDICSYMPLIILEKL